MLRGWAQAIGTQCVLKALGSTDVLTSLQYASVCWLGFTLTLWHHDTWTMRSLPLSSLLQSSEFIGGLIIAAVVTLVGW